MATIQSMITSRNGITKFVRGYSLKDINTLTESESMLSATWNRSEVTKHAGTAEKLFESIIRGFSILMFLGYWNGKAETITDIKPTKTSPLTLTEGGHRWRWLKRILAGDVAINGVTLADIQRTDPTLYDTIMSHQVIIEVKIHISGVVPENYVKEEYVAVNTNGSLLNFGEISRANYDDNANKLCDVFKTAFPHRTKALNTRNKTRDGGAAILNTFIRTLASNDYAMMKSTDKTLPSVNDEQFVEVRRMIQAIGNIESDTYMTAAKQIRPVMSTAPDVKLHGAMFYGLSTADPATALDTISKFYTKAIVNKDAFRENVNLVIDKKDGGNGGGRMGKQFYENAWARLRAIANPVQPHDTSNTAQVIDLLKA